MHGSCRGSIRPSEAQLITYICDKALQDSTLLELLLQTHRKQDGYEASVRAVGYLLLTLIQLTLHDKLGISALQKLVVCHTDSGLLLLHLLLQGSFLGNQRILQLCQGTVFGVQSSLPILPCFL